MAPPPVPQHNCGFDYDLHTAQGVLGLKYIEFRGHYRSSLVCCDLRGRGRYPERLLGQQQKCEQAAEEGHLELLKQVGPVKQRLLGP